MNPLMMKGNGSSNQATNPTNSLNVATPSVRRTFNRFNNSYVHYSTANYGEYTPFFVQEMNPADLKKFRSKTQVRSESLKTPLYSGVKMNKDYFFVPFDALLPNNWQKIFKNPSQGDDVPDDANMASLDFLVAGGQLETLVSNFVHALEFLRTHPRTGSTEAEKQKRLNAIYVVYFGFPLMDAFFSSSGICARLGSPFSHLFNFKIGNSPYTWDRFVEYIYPLLFEDSMQFGFRFSSAGTSGEYLFTIDSSVSGKSSFIQQLSGTPSLARISPKDVLALFRYYPSCMYGYNGWVDMYDKLNFTSLSQNISQTISYSFVSNPPSAGSQDAVFNYSRMAAYALCCSQFYTNGNVDSIYNAELYRDMMSSFVRGFLPVSTSMTFLYNGVKTQYDWLSSHYFDIAMNSAFDFESSDAMSFDAIFYLRSIFDIHNTLKYGDYFSGAHTRPLAVGDVTAPVIGDKVSAVDITKAISYQRFLNVVVKLKNEMQDYLRTIFGTLPAPDYHEAKLVSHSEGAVDGFEVANTTSEDQGNLTSLLHNVQENFEFTLEIDQAGIAIGVVSFVASRAYCLASDRQVHIRDRYDMFNPMLQNIGDQPVLGVEKSGFFAEPFAYHSRFMEYKQRVNIASGAFVDKLRSYCIISDSLFEPSNALEVLAQNLTPAYIRLTPREFDRFFVVNGSWSYGNNYHFICEFDNESDDIREADYSPSIL